MPCGVDIEMLILLHIVLDTLCNTSRDATSQDYEKLALQCVPPELDSWQRLLSIQSSLARVFVALIDELLVEAM